MISGAYVGNRKKFDKLDSVWGKKNYFFTRRSTKGSDDAVKASLSQKEEKTESSKKVFTIERRRLPAVGLH